MTGSPPTTARGTWRGGRGALHDGSGSGSARGNGGAAGACRDGGAGARRGADGAARRPRRGRRAAWGADRCGGVRRRTRRRGVPPRGARLRARPRAEPVGRAGCGPQRSGRRDDPRPLPPGNHRGHGGAAVAPGAAVRRGPAPPHGGPGPRARGHRRSRPAHAASGRPGVRLLARGCRTGLVRAVDFRRDHLAPGRTPAGRTSALRHRRGHGAGRPRRRHRPGLPRGPQRRPHRSRRARHRQHRFDRGLPARGRPPRVARRVGARRAAGAGRRRPHLRQLPRRPRRPRPPLRPVRHRRLPGLRRGTALQRRWRRHHARAARHRRGRRGHRRAGPALCGRRGLHPVLGLVRRLDGPGLGAVPAGRARSLGRR